MRSNNSGLRWNRVLEYSPGTPKRGSNSAVGPEPVRAGHFTRCLAPQEQMQVVGIEAVEIERFAGAFTRAAKCQFAQAADLTQAVRNLAAARARYTANSSFSQTGVRRLALRRSQLAGRFRRPMGAIAFWENRWETGPDRCLAAHRRGPPAGKSGSADIRWPPARPPTTSGPWRRPAGRCCTSILRPRLLSVWRGRSAVRKRGCSAPISWNPKPLDPLT